MPPRKKREPQQTTFIKPAPALIKNGDILDVDEAAALLKVSKKTLYNRVKNVSDHIPLKALMSDHFPLDIVPPSDGKYLYYNPLAQGE